MGDYKRRLGLEYVENEICVGGGAKQVLFLALMASVDDDAEVIIPAPYWVSYPDMVIANGGKPVVVECPRIVFQVNPGCVGGRHHAQNTMVDTEYTVKSHWRCLFPC